MTKREQEQRLMLLHEERMRRPVRELFPRPTGISRVMTCKRCNKEYTWTPKDGIIRAYCSSYCRDAMKRSA